VCQVSKSPLSVISVPSSFIIVLNLSSYSMAAQCTVLLFVVALHDAFFHKFLIYFQIVNYPLFLSSAKELVTKLKYIFQSNPILVSRHLFT
jgi:hypothetical protein